MFRKTVSGVTLFLLLISVFSLVVNIKQVKGEWTGTVYIRADGSIDPPDAPIITYDNITYTLTDNISSSGDGIIVDRDNIIIDGAGFTIQGTSQYPYVGVHINAKTNVTLRKMNIRNFNNGIFLNMSSYNNVSGNNITDNVWNGIWLWNSTYNSFCENVIANNKWGESIYLSCSSNYNNISRNNISMNKRSPGIYLSQSLNNNISGNIITDNVWGIRLYYSSSIIYNNKIMSNQVGIYLECSSNNTITGNMLVSNGDGILVENSWNNIIQYNNFINNEIQAITVTSPFNVWDDGYPSGGNYWSDYAGVDNNGDGIGDTPYVIDENNIDRYPLMNPWGSGTPIASFTWTPSVPEVGGVVTFDASVSMPVGGEIVSYEWDFGDGSHAVGKIITHAYGSAGTFIVTLNVTDSEGLWDIEQKQIEVKAPPPPLTVSISPLSASILLGESVTFTSTTSGGCPPYSYQWYLNGDPVSGATSDTWTFTPTTSGVYYVYVKVIDVRNDVAQSEIAYISVTSAPVVAPIAAFTWSPCSPLEGETVVFDASASRPDSGEIVRFEWSFGDGESGEGRFVTHTYSRAGLYKVTLTVFSSEGLSDDVSDYIFVRPKCFILTAVLGTDAEGDLNYLRLFRDKILRTNPVGEAFVTFYYEASPPIAEQLIRNHLLKVLTAILFVQPLIITVKILLSPYSIALYAALALLFLYAAKKRKLKALLTFLQVSAITATTISLTALTLGLIAKTIPQASIIASIMLPTIIPTAIITATIKTFKKQRKKPTISSANL